MSSTASEKQPDRRSGDRRRDSRRSEGFERFGQSGIGSFINGPRDVPLAVMHTGEGRLLLTSAEPMNPPISRRLLMRFEGGEGAVPLSVRKLEIAEDDTVVFECVLVHDRRRTDRRGRNSGRRSED